MTDTWHVGRAAIIDYFYSMGFLRSNKITAWRTVKRWEKKELIIIRHDSSNRPFVIEGEIEKQKLYQSEKIISKKS
jgi:hypothetical protein